MITTKSASPKPFISFFMAVITAAALMFLFEGWIFPGWSGILARAAVSFFSIFWLGLFFYRTVDRWNSAIAFALFMCAVLFLLDGVMLAVVQHVPHLESPYGNVTSLIMRPPPPEATPPLDHDVYGMPLPLAVFAGIFSAFAAAVLGWRTLRGSLVDNPHALADLEARYPETKGFAQWHEKTLGPAMAHNEQRRRYIMDRRNLAYATHMVFVPAFLTLVGLFNLGPYYGMMLQIIGSLVVLMTLWTWVEQNFAVPVMEAKASFSNYLADRIAWFLKLEYSALAGGMMDLDSFARLHLVPTIYTFYKDTSSRFSGKHNGVGFRICHAVLQNAQEGVLFSGALIEMSFPEPFPANVWVMRDRGRIRNALRNAVFLREQRINLVYHGFENLFEVYGDDQVKARVMLTPDVMESFANLSRLLAGQLSIQAAFTGRRLLIAVDMNTDLFDIGNLDIPMTDQDRIARCAEQIMQLHRVIDTVGVQARENLPGQAS